ncbi:MAG: hypothetical protein CL902_00630 [Dehalococcoidia bacterium]|nr:hypothetical protein [Dehalococcoidia bacterium]
MAAVSYHLSDRFRPEEARFVHSTLNDKRGWMGVAPHISAFERAEHGQPVLFTMDIISNKEIVNKFPGAGMDGFSVTDRGTRPIEVTINRSNWDHPPADFQGTDEMYRQYVLLHEVGHVLGLNHVAWRPGVSCPTMMQQTRGTKGKCGASPWPVDSAWELKKSGHERNAMLPTISGGAKKRKLKRKNKTRKHVSFAADGTGVRSAAARAVAAMDDVATPLTMLRMVTECENIMCGHSIATQQDLREWNQHNVQSDQYSRIQQCGEQSNYCPSPLLAKENQIVRSFYRTNDLGSETQ